MTLDLDDDFIEVDESTGEVIFVTTPRRRRRRKSSPPRDLDVPLWSANEDPFRAASCRPDSTRRFLLLLAARRDAPDFDRVRRGRVWIEDLPVGTERHTAALVGENAIA